MENNSSISPNSLQNGQSKDNNSTGKIQPIFNYDRYIWKQDSAKEIRSLNKKIDEASENKGLFKVKTANRWIEQAKIRPIPKMLLGVLWFEGELCILFADTNVGKSILAVQIANSISKGESIDGLKQEGSKQPVVYIDFEQSDKQFENRYSKNYTEHYSFDDNFIRVEINPDAEIPENRNFEDFLYQSIERTIIETGAKILIIDNLTYLKTETEKAKDALPLMKQLKALKIKYGLSILALAHTPKRDMSKPITRNDLQGSKMLINFCDSAFSIGESFNDKGIRYIKQIKARNTEIIYDSENVIVCVIEKPHNFLHFRFLNFSTEREHLKEISDSDKKDLENSIREIIGLDPETKAYTIAKQLCPDESKFDSFKVKVNRIVNKIRTSSKSSG